MTPRALRRTARTLGLLAAGALLLATGACSAEDLADQVAERAIENAAGEGADAGEFKVETDEGTFSSGGSLPDDFPSDEVPLLDGEVLQAASSTQAGSAGYVVIVVVDEGVEEAVEAANQRLLDAGFAPDTDLAGIEGLSVKTLSKAPYTVLLSAYDTGDGTAVNYTISIE